MAAGDRFALPAPGQPPPTVFAGSVTSPAGYLLSLWQSESLRTFCDKMISHEDKTWVSDAIQGLCKYAPPGGSLVQLPLLCTGCWRQCACSRLGLA